MCAVDNPEHGMEPLSLDEGSSSLSSLAEDDQDISDLEVSSSKRARKVKMMCSYGGRILPRPQDGQLRYVGGETRILVVKKNVRYKDLMDKLSRMVGRRDLSLKYQLPNEDLDALISVRSDEDVSNMMEEYEKVESRFGDGSVKLRVFLFPSKGLSSSSPSRTAIAAMATETEYSSSDESSLVDSAKMGAHKPRIPRNHLGKLPKQQDDFGSLRLFQEQQQQQSPRAGAEGKTRSHFQDGENGHLDFHHQNQNPAPFYLKNSGSGNQGTNFFVQCKGCTSCAARPPHPSQALQHHHMMNHYHQYPPPYHHHVQHHPPPPAPAKFCNNANLQYGRHELPPIATTKFPYDFYSNNHHGHLHYQQ